MAARARLNMSMRQLGSTATPQLMWGATGMRDFTLPGCSPHRSNTSSPKEGKLIIFPN
jgi:hypothetical protein